MIRRFLTRTYVRRKLKADYKAGLMSRQQYRKVIRACNSDVCEAAVGGAVSKSGRDWPVLTSLWNFIVENWDEILKIVLTLAMMVLDGED